MGDEWQDGRMEEWKVGRKSKMAGGKGVIRNSSTWSHSIREDGKRATFG